MYKWKIYLSSTYLDLKDARQALRLYFEQQLSNHFELSDIMEKMYDTGQTSGITMRHRQELQQQLQQVLQRRQQQQQFDSPTPAQTFLNEPLLLRGILFTKAFTSLNELTIDEMYWLENIAGLKELNNLLTLNIGPNHISTLRLYSSNQSIKRLVLLESEVKSFYGAEHLKLQSLKFAGISSDLFYKFSPSSLDTLSLFIITLANEIDISYHNKDLRETDSLRQVIKSKRPGVMLLDHELDYLTR